MFTLYIYSFIDIFDVGKLSCRIVGNLFGEITARIMEMKKKERTGICYIGVTIWTRYMCTVEEQRGSG